MSFWGARDVPSKVWVDDPRREAGQNGWFSQSPRKHRAAFPSWGESYSRSAIHVAVTPVSTEPSADMFAKANMKSKSSSTVDLIFRGFSDRTRLRILNMLRGGELCVCNIVEVLGVPQPKVSRHLAYLRKAGLVTVRKEGQWCYYTLAPTRNKFHEKILDCLCCCLSEVPELVKDGKLLKLRTDCCG
jgi:ArsR family transcriptional regulator, arsenate/arsenite/antimonite-responsive transcriptional repressor